MAAATIDLSEVGARATGAAGGTEVAFGIHLPGIAYTKGYTVRVRVIHALDEYDPEVPGTEAWLNWDYGSPLDHWGATIALAPGPGHFGDPGRYLYRYQVLRGDRPVTPWFSDPFARTAGPGTLSAFDTDPGADAFSWTDAGFRVPGLDEMVVYELNVREFNRDFDGVVTQLDYLAGLGVNVLELMPVTNVGEHVEWGYTPLGYFAPDDRIGGTAGMRRLIDACHARGIGVIVDAVYAHAHPDFGYNVVYDATGEPNPMMGPFAGEFFDRPGTDFRKPFTTAYFLTVNQYWLDALHVDGFRYDYVPGIYTGGPLDPGYPQLVYETYRLSKDIDRFDVGGGRSSIIQCAEHLPDPIGILSKTYSSCCWQNGLLDRTRDMAAWRYVSVDLGHLLDPELIGYPTEYRNSATGDSFPVAPFQYIESHDHERFINVVGRERRRDLLGEPYGERSLFYKVQPYVIALYTGKGIPMLWQGQELVENWGLPGGGLGRNLFERPLHWEYFSDDPGRAMVRLHRIMGGLRRARRALRARNGYFYFDRDDHRAVGVVAYRRTAPADGALAEDDLLVAVNFFDADAHVWLPFGRAGEWTELIDGTQTIEVAAGGDWHQVMVPSNYGAVLAPA